MAESSLSVGYPELIGETGNFLGYGYKAYASYAAGQQSELNRLVQSGVRRVYYPTALDAERFAGYEWSWLRPTKTLEIAASDGDYDLPDDFGRLIGEINYPAAAYLPPIAIIAVNRLLAMRASSDLSGDPMYAATRYKASDGTNGQRQEILFYPEPDTARTLSYEYEAYSGALSASNPYPLGGMQLAELYIESCLSVAESRIEDSPGTHTEQFKALLVDAITRDQKRGPRRFGQMGQPQDCEDSSFRRGITGTTYPITYKGVSI
jgi:hypothetical protein